MTSLPPSEEGTLFISAYILKHTCICKYICIYVGEIHTHTLSVYRPRGLLQYLRLTDCCGLHPQEERSTESQRTVRAVSSNIL